MKKLGFLSYVFGATHRVLNEQEAKIKRLENQNKELRDWNTKLEKDNAAGAVTTRKQADENKYLKGEVERQANFIKDVQLEYDQWMKEKKDQLAEATVFADKKEKALLKEKEAHKINVDRAKSELAEKDKLINEQIEKISALENKIKDLQKPTSPVSRKKRSIKKAINK